VILRHIHTHEGNDTNFYILSLRKAIFSNISILEKAFNAKFFDPGKVLSGENVLRPTPIRGNSRYIFAKKLLMEHNVFANARSIQRQRITMHSGVR